MLVSAVIAAEQHSSTEPVAWDGPFRRPIHEDCFMLVYGHRGAQGEAPESTLAGFRHAIAIGLQAVEFDVQLTADDEVVVIHDATVDRTTNGSGAVASFTLAEIRALDARAQFPEWPERCQVPTFAEVLDVVGELPTLLVEIKRGPPERLDVLVPATIALIAEHRYPDTVHISSFDPYALDIAKRIAPAIPRTLNGAWREPAFRARAIAAGCAEVDFDYKIVGREHVDWARSNGLSIVGWPCNTVDDLQELMEFGVDAVGSDRPSLILQFLKTIAGE